MCHLSVTERTAAKRGYLNLNFPSINHGYQLSPATALKHQPWWKASDVYHISEHAHSHRRDGPARHTVWLFQMSSAWFSFGFTHRQKQSLPHKNKPVGFTVRKGHSDWLLGDYYSPTSRSARWGGQKLIQKLCEGEWTTETLGDKKPFGS